MYTTFTDMKSAVLKRNYKTTATAGVAAAASFVLFAQTGHYVNFPPWAIAMAAFCQIGGLAAFGVMAKDYNTTGGSNGQPSTPAALNASNVSPSVSNPPAAPEAASKN